MTKTPVILIVDDAQHELFLLEGYLQEWGYTSLSARNGVEALAVLADHDVDAILSDQEMDEMDGLELLRQVRRTHPTRPFIMLTAHGSSEKAVEAMKHGAWDYLAKPCDPVQLQAKIARLLGYPRLPRAEQDVQATWTSAILTNSPKMRNMLKQVSNVIPSPTTTVLILGESGTGKELLAHAIHEAGGGKPDTFVAVNCAAAPAGLLDSELFGHVKGAFTGADKNREGKFARARHGTLLLDEIGDMPADLQVKLLRVLQERTYETLGTNTLQPMECRIVAATHKNLQELTTAGTFREDLFYRVHDFPITIPPLRERKEDVLLLADHFLTQFCQEHDMYIPGISPEAMEHLVNYQWPGNVRELQQTIRRAALTVDNGPILPCHLNIPRYVPLQRDGSLYENGIWLDEQTIRLVFEGTREEFSLKTLTDYALQAALEVCSNKVATAAKLLKVDRKMYYRREKKAE